MSSIRATSPPSCTRSTRTCGCSPPRTAVRSGPTSPSARYRMPNEERAMSTATRAFAKGDRVMFAEDAPVRDNPRHLVFTVEAVPQGRRKNYYIRAAAGSGQYSVGADMLRPAPEGNATVVSVPFVAREIFVLGEVVPVRSGGGRIPPDEPYVVTKNDGSNKVNIAKLGGEGDRYWRWPAAGLVKRDRA